MSRDVVVVGAGLAGLACARTLRRTGVEPLVLDAADAPGGRVRTDIVEGFRIDRGFQVLLDSYPEARRQLDMSALRLCPFEPGALVRRDGRFQRFDDPWRRPLLSLATAAEPLATIADKARLMRFRERVLSRTTEELLAAPQETTLERLRGEGFSEAFIEGFFRPFYGGVFLDRSLSCSSRMLEFTFSMFARGAACLPELGMQAIPDQLAAELTGSIRLGARVMSVRDGVVTLESGEALRARAVVVATDALAARRLLGDAVPAPRRFSGTTCLSFAAQRDPVGEPMLVLDGDGEGPVNELCVPSTVAPSYAPDDAVLVSASICGIPDAGNAELEAAARAQMTRWFGGQVAGWRLLRVERVPLGLPDASPDAFIEARKAARLAPGLIACGDWMDTASIDGALGSGRRAAEAVLAELRA